MTFDEWWNKQVAASTVYPMDEDAARLSWNAAIKYERQRIIEANAPEIDKCNKWIAAANTLNDFKPRGGW